MVDFIADLKRGRQGEVLVAEALRLQGYNVEDVTNNSDYWEKDIDFLIDGKSLEVKSDWNIGTTGNVVLELRNRVNGKAGWFYGTEAINLAFVDMQNRICYLIKTKDLREFVDGNIKAEAAAIEAGSNASKNILREKTLNNYFCVLLNIREAESYGLEFYRMAV